MIQVLGEDKNTVKINNSKDTRVPLLYSTYPISIEIEDT